jgi:hypothetical protein
VENNRVTKNKEQVALKVEILRGSQDSGSGGKEHPSKYVKEDSWYEMTTQDAQEKEASKSMICWKYLKTGSSKMVGIAFVSEGEANQVDWRIVVVAYLVA